MDSLGAMIFSGMINMEEPSRRVKSNQKGIKKLIKACFLIRRKTNEAL